MRLSLIMREFKWVAFLKDTMGITPRNILDLCDDETEFLIMTCLQSLGPLSTKNLLKIIPTSKATVYRKISSLVDKNYIEIDPVKTAKLKCKYYQISSFIDDIIEEETGKGNESKEFLDKETQENPQATVNKLTNAFNSLSILNTNLFKLFVLSQMKNQVPQNAQVKSSMTFMSLDVQGSNWEKVIAIIDEFEEKLKPYKTSALKLDENAFPIFLTYFPLNLSSILDILDSDT